VPRIKRKFDGPLGERIEVKVVPIKGETAEAFARRWAIAFGELATAKVPELAKAFLPSASAFDPANPTNFATGCVPISHAAARPGSASRHPATFAFGFSPGDYMSSARGRYSSF
jgi:hypothetical protein